MNKKRQIISKLSKIKLEFDQAYQAMKIDNKNSKLNDLEEEMTNSQIWENPERATKVSQDISKLKDEIQPWMALKVQLNDYQELLEITDDNWLDEADKNIDKMADQLNQLSQTLMFDGEYDNNDVILRLTSGVGGLDAQDFTEMLERMYLRFCDAQNFKTTNIERQTSQEAGIKTSVIEISGVNAYGMLKSENGVHRLVRRSPFNSDNLRQTSFALVEVLPKIETEDFEIDQNDLKIDYFRAGGHGGQSVNTTDSAVRITHIPTKTVVSIQNERSQIQNKALAMSILTAKLIELKEKQHADDLNHLKAGESASWGSQIRNYVFDPYTMVKDTRTKYQETDVDKVLNGQINGFIEAYLKQKNN